jgi:hypothetical protein
LGIEGGEIAAMIQIAMMGEVPYTTLRDTVFSHPTLSESLNTLFAAIEEDEVQMTSQAEMGLKS